MPRYDLKMIPDQIGLDQEFSESLKFTITKFPPPSMPMPPDVLDLIPSQMKQFEKAGKLIIKGEVGNYLFECLELNAKDCFVATASKVFVAKGIPMMLSRMATGSTLTPKVLKNIVQIFYVRVGQGASEYSDQKIRPLLVRYFEEWHGLYSRWAPADLDDVAVGTPGSAARRHEKKTVAPYRSYEVKESVNMVSTAPITMETFEPPTSDTEGKDETPRKRERYSARFSKVPSYRSFAVDEPTPTNLHARKNTKRAAFEDPPSPTTQCNKRVKISTNDPNFYGVKSGLEPLRKALTKIRGKKTAKVSSIKRE
ncbi:hypothetical protein EV368DRAFT_67578 [Lentinula lateritia]|nr:hypothetical protein EV368DRAFT_67578 [Lentinula lateritia]